MIGASSTGHRTAIMPPGMLNSTGPMRGGRSGSSFTRRAKPTGAAPKSSATPHAAATRRA
jgi:hypothetical protein